MSEMTRYWQRWCWKLALGSSLVGGAIASSGNFALAQIALNTTQEAESSFFIPVDKFDQFDLFSIPKIPQVQSTEEVLILQSLVCNSTGAGGTNTDQIFLKVEDQTVWSGSMNPGDNVNLSPAKEMFHKKVYIELSAGSTRRGGYIISSGKGSFSITNGSASYTLTYEVVDE